MNETTQIFSQNENIPKMGNMKETQSDIINSLLATVSYTNKEKFTDELVLNSLTESFIQLNTLLINGSIAEENFNKMITIITKTKDIQENLLEVIKNMDNIKHISNSMSEIDKNLKSLQNNITQLTNTLTSVVGEINKLKKTETNDNVSILDKINTGGKDNSKSIIYIVIGMGVFNTLLTVLLKFVH